MTEGEKKHSHAAFCLMFISRELLSGVAHDDVLAFNSLSGLFTVEQLRNVRVGGVRRKGHYILVGELINKPAI